MTNIDNKKLVINLNSINLKNGQQIGKGAKKTDESKIDYKDGLTGTELKNLDTANGTKKGDNKLTFSEFKAAYGEKGADDAWNELLGSLGINSSSTVKSGKYKDGTQIKQTFNGTETTSIYDKNGKLVKYSSENNGVTKTYEVDNGKNVLVSKTENPALGKSKSTTYKDGKPVGDTYETADGTTVKRNSNDQLTKIEFPKSANQSPIEFGYDNDGNYSSIKIGDKVYKGEDLQVKEENGKTIFYDKDNKKLAKIGPNSKNEQGIVLYDEKGKKSTYLKFDKKGYPYSISKYDNNGQITTKYICAKQIERKFVHNDDGSIKYSVDVDRVGNLVSKQTYNKDNEWATRTMYKEGTEVTYDDKKNPVIPEDAVRTQEKSYKYNQDGTISSTVKGYGDESKPNLVTSTTELLLDSDRNKIKETIKRNDFDTTIKEYKNGVLQTKTSKTLKDGKEEITVSTYEYDQNGNLTARVDTNKTTGKVIRNTGYDRKTNKFTKSEEVKQNNSSGATTTTSNDSSTKDNAATTNSNPSQTTNKTTTEESQTTERPKNVPETNGEKIAQNTIDTFNEWDALTKLINNQNLTGQDFVDAMKYYMNYQSNIDHTNIMERAFGERGTLNSSYQTILANKLVDAARGGNKDAKELLLLCVEQATQVTNPNGYQNFYGTLFNDTNKNVALKIIQSKYPNFTV